MHRLNHIALLLAVAMPGCGDSEGGGDGAAFGPGRSGAGAGFGAGGFGAPADMSPGGAGTGAAGGFGPGAQAPNGGDGDAMMGPMTGLPPPPPPLDPEVESALNFELPQASEAFVYIANPNADSVAIINAGNLTIETVETGDEPTYLKTLEGQDAAIVLNVGSSDATVIRTGSAGSTTSTVDVVPGANAIEVSPNGEHAVVYFDSLAENASISGSFQDVSIIRMKSDEDTVTDMTVGFRPRDVFFSSDSKRAFVITEDGVSILDFAEILTSGSGIAPRVELGTGLDRRSTDVSVTPDGRYALAREEEAQTLRLVDLDDGTIHDLDIPEDILPGVERKEVEISDLDLSPTGKVAIAVLRRQFSVLEIPVPGGFLDPSEVALSTTDGELIGSVAIAPDGAKALLFTTATDDERVTIMEVGAEDPFRTFDLRKTVKAVVFAPDSLNAMIVHRKKDGDPKQVGLDPDEMIDRSYGYSLMKLGAGNVKLQVTSTPPGASVITPDGTHLFVVFRDDARDLREVQRVELKSFLVDPIELGSPPVSVGAVEASGRVFVGQEHPDGRITFIDWTSGDVQSVTGFELNSKVRE